MIVERIKALQAGTVIPKPDARADFTVKGWGTRRGEEALIFHIPNHNDSRKPYQKGITVREWELAYQQLVAAGHFGRKWFNLHMAACASEGGCNFTTIGGVFELLGIASYERGDYHRRTL